jgi:hypothetical protein
MPGEKKLVGAIRYLGESLGEAADNADPYCTDLIKFLITPTLVGTLIFVRVRVVAPNGT